MHIKIDHDWNEEDMHARSVMAERKESVHTHKMNDAMYS